jgi:predicted transcriptional regulator of viral defense system
MGQYYPYNETERKVKTADFLVSHPVFSLEEAASALAPRGGKAGTVERLKHHLASGRLKLVARSVYAAVPPGADAKRFMPDPFLVAVASRPDAVFSHHSALELLGVSHSVWNQTTLYTRRRRRQVILNDVNIRFLDHPMAMRGRDGNEFATRAMERQGRLLRVTGPERTLVEGFSRPGLVGGLEELVVSAGGFPVLDLGLLKKVLARYRVAKLRAAVGWFLEHFQGRFEVPSALLKDLEKSRPASPQYLLREKRGGTLDSRWNLILPPEMTGMGEPDES